MSDKTEVTRAQVQRSIARLAEISCGARQLDIYLRGISVDVLGAWSARTAALFSLQPDLTIRCESFFGIRRIRSEEWNGTSILQDSPLTECLRGQVLVLSSDNLPWLLPEAAAHSLFLPIRRRHAPIGALWLSFERDSSYHENPDFWGFVAGAAGLALLAQSTPRSIDLSNQIQNPVELSDRQQQILHLVAAGATNREAARSLHLGLSTVAHELMTIFQQLGVTNRKDAVREAGARGILSARHPPIK